MSARGDRPTGRGEPLPWWSRLHSAYARWVEPAATGLPNWRVVLFLPAVLAIGATVLIALQISGTSSGSYWLFFGEGDDPRLLAGGPRPIRSDEWLVQQSWVISQAQQGFPAVNGTFPGGMDATVLMELPAWDWPTIFRPHLWGYLLFGVGVGVAWQWWLPAFGLVAGAYLLVVTLAPRRAITAALIASATFFSPIFQWWYGPNQMWPSAWVLLTIAALVWALRDDRVWTRIAWAVPVGFLAVTAAIGLYVPFIVPPLVVLVFVAIGALIGARPARARDWGRTLARIVPLTLAAVGAGIAILAFSITRAATFEAVQSTVYPGERSDPTGQLWAQDPDLIGIGGAVVGQSFRSSAPNVLGPNPSEASTAILFALFVAPALIALVVRAIRRERRADWLAIGALAGLAVIVAYLLVPGWDPIARLLLLDRVPIGRARMAFAPMLPLFFAIIVREVDRVGDALRSRWVLAGVSAAIAAFASLGVVWRVHALEPATLDDVFLWPVVAAGIVAGSGLVFIRRLAPAAAGALLIASLVIGGPVNPLYRGVFDLNETEAGRAMTEIDDADPGDWVGVGDMAMMALVMQTGVDGYSGVQSYPPEEMWEQIDPDGDAEEAWNRLAHVRWLFGPGEPQITTPTRDIILVTFDACSDFAQSHVEYVVTDETPPSEACLEELSTQRQGGTETTIYAVVPDRS